MEEKIQSVQYRDSEPSEFAHKPPKQEMDLSCLSEQISAIRVPPWNRRRLGKVTECRRHPFAAMLVLEQGARWVARAPCRGEGRRAVRQARELETVARIRGGAYILSPNTPTHA